MIITNRILQEIFFSQSFRNFFSCILFIRSFCNLETKHLHCRNFFSATVASYITDTGSENSFFNNVNLSLYLQQHVSPNKESLRITRHKKIHLNVNTNNTVTQ